MSDGDLRAIWADGNVIYYPCKFENDNVNEIELLCVRQISIKSSLV